MLDLGQQIRLILVRASMAGKIKAIAGDKGAAVARTDANQVAGFLFLHANLRARFAFGLLGIFARIIEDFILVVTADLENRLFVGQQARAGSLEIVVRHRVFSRTKLLLEIPGTNEVLIFAIDTSGEVQTDFGLAGTGLVNAGLITHDQGVFILFVFEEIKDAVLLHEARNEVEVRFAILNAVFTLLKVALQRILEIPEAAILEDFCHDVRNSHVLEDTAIGVPGEKPGPGNNLGMIVSKPSVHAYLGKPAHKTIQVALASIREID